MILHITNDYNLTKVHKELYKALDNSGVKQKIFIPLRNDKQIGKNHFKFLTNESDYIYSNKINLIHRIFFPYKISTLFKSLEKKIDLKEIKLIHATTLFSDGAIAYKLNKKYKIPYIVAVRNTDINFYFNNRKELIPLGINILKNASKIIFISESNRKAFINKEKIKPIRNIINSKIEVINNGIDEFWLNNIYPYQPTNGYNFLFIGRFDKNKNVERLIDALSEVKDKKNIPITLNLVGGTGVNHKSVLEKISKLDWITYNGEIYDKNSLLEIIRNTNYFSLISHYETFGLVYLEALSQGKPILYTKNQGVDGVFELNLGERTDSKNLNEIIEKIEKLLSNQYEDINSIDFNKFSWISISEKYQQLYNYTI
ncbi:glycosyltransferase family 4 protein [Empedobacter falsenii]